MNKFPVFLRRLFLVLLLVMTMLMLATPAFALGVRLQEGPPASSSIDFLIQLIFGIVLTVPGFTALGVVVINLLKIPGWVTDGNSQVALNIFNVISAVVIGALTLLAPAINITAVDETFGKLAGTLTVLLPAFVLLFKWLAPHFYSAIRGVPAIGYSYTLEKAKAKTKAK